MIVDVPAETRSLPHSDPLEWLSGLNQYGGWTKAIQNVSVNGAIVPGANHTGEQLVQRNGYHSSEV